MSVKQFILRIFSDVPSFIPCSLGKWPERPDICTNFREEKLYHGKTVFFNSMKKLCKRQNTSSVFPRPPASDNACMNFN